MFVGENGIKADRPVVSVLQVWWML